MPNFASTITYAAKQYGLIIEYAGRRSRGRNRDLGPNDSAAEE